LKSGMQETCLKDSDRKKKAKTQVLTPVIILEKEKTPGRLKAT